MHTYVCTYVNDMYTHVYIHNIIMYEHNDMYHEVLKTVDT